MRGSLAVIATALLLVATFATPAGAISNGQEDTNGKFPYVGLVMVPATGGGFWLCSGALIEGGKKVLTAAHCIDDYSSPGPETAFFSVKSHPQSLDDFEIGTIHPHPGWCIGCGPGLKGFDTRDVAVIVLDGQINLPKYAKLPSQGYVDKLRNQSKVDIVGYGLQRVMGKAKLAPTDKRYYAVTKLLPSKHVHSSEFIKLGAGKGMGMGGTCFGDSGGPNLKHGTDRILAVTSYGNNAICAGVGYSNRIDLKDVLQFINSTN